MRYKWRIPEASAGKIPCHLITTHLLDRIDCKTESIEFTQSYQRQERRYAANKSICIHDLWSGNGSPRVLSTVELVKICLQIYLI